jgi:ABC-type branched-subunit amino acid transport system substrate-binding protein
MRRTWLQLLSLLLAGTLIAAACGSDRDDDGGAAGGGTTTTEADGDGDGDGEGEAVMFGDLESPCGEAEDGEENADGTDQGVTADSIVIGYGDDAGFSGSPGLNSEQSDAVAALIEWCNEQGGINGRTIDGKYYDAKITEVNNVMLQACDEVFMLVGQGFALDALQEETRVGCELASVPAWSVSPPFAHGPMMIQPVPNPVDFTPSFGGAAMQELFPEEVKKVATMVANYAATLDTRAKVKSAFPSFGWEFLNCDVEYNIAGEADWRPFAQRLKDCGAEIVYFSGSPFPNFQNYLEAADQVDFKPLYFVDVNFYEEDFIEWNANGLADNVYMRFAFVPFEEADDSPAISDYLEIVRGAGGDVSILGAQATSAFLLWATGVKACGSDLTRQCVLDAIADLGEWTGGGLHAPTQPAENMPPSCEALLKLEAGSIKRVKPEEPASFECDDSYVAEVSGPVVDQAQLNDDRVSTLFLEG